jgi:hypothetical protein
MHRQRLGVQLDSGDLRVQFPGAIVLIVIGVLCGIGVGVFQGSRSGDEVGGSGERLAIRGVGGWRWSGRVARPDRELQIDPSLFVKELLKWSRARWVGPSTVIDGGA